MASSKKQTSRPKVTLHNFFPRPGASNEKVNVRASKTERKQRSTQAASTASTGDIIIIDSDSDDESHAPLQAQQRKRRRLSESSGEVEFVDQLHTKRRRPLTPSPTGSDMSFGQPSGPLNSRSAPLDLGPAQVDDVLSGVPSMILNCVHDTLSFGAPTLLLGSDNGEALLSGQMPKHEKLSSSHLHPVKDGDQVHSEDIKTCTDFPAEAGDDWGMGDDETEFVPALEDEEDIDFEDVQSEDRSVTNVITAPTLIEHPSTCPSCGNELKGLSQIELEVHVNACLDSVSRPTMASTQAPKTFLPLSPCPSSRPVHGSLHLVSSDGRTDAGGSNAFSLLMSSHEENEAWKEVTTVEDRNFRPTKENGGRRKAPFFKVLQGMPIAVDAFRYGSIPGVTAYFLTHAHSDHFTNLSSSWKSGPIYCSEGTANLIIHMLSVDRKYVHALPMDDSTVIPNTNGVRVTLIEANHCPGSCLFYFEGPQTVNAGDSAFKSPYVGSPKIYRYLHCGDFRASPQHVLHPALKGKKIDLVYLDTTYLDPKYAFPPQPLVISACAELAKRLVAGQSINEKVSTMDSWMTSPKDGVSGKQTTRTLVIVGTYSIGKERIVKAIAHALNAKIYCDARKAAILRCQADKELDALLTSDPLEASVHLVPLGLITSDKLKTYVARFKGNFSKAIGFRPTGWSYTPPAGTEQTPSVTSIISRSGQRTFTYANLHPARNSRPSLQLFSVPYSEHSSFFELTCFAMSFDWGKMIATVNVGSENSRGKMAKWVARWEAERKKQSKGMIVPHRHPDYW